MINIKGLILAGGQGIRLRPITYSRQKHIIPIANKPIIFYCIEDLISAGVKDIGVIVGPDHEQIKAVINSADWDAKITFIVQETPGGLAHAVRTGKDFLGDSRFIVYLGDNLLRDGSKNFVDAFRNSSDNASLLLTEVEHPEMYGLALVDEQKKVITELLEKPKNPPTNLSIVGIYGLTPMIWEAIENIKPSWRGELEITDALQWLVANKKKVSFSRVEGWWKDTGGAEDMLDANRLILEKLEPENRGTVTRSTVEGRAKIGKNTVIECSVIRGPAIIGEGCRIFNTYIGPYTSIGDGCTLERTEVENSIVMANTKIRHVDKVTASLIGTDVSISKGASLPKGSKMVVGDGSKIVL